MRKSFFLFLFAVFSFTTICEAQINTNKGTEFWIGMMQDYHQNEGSCDVTIYSDRSITGTVSIPASGWSQNFSFAANEFVRINIPATFTDLKETGIFPYGILVETSDSAWVIANGSSNEDYTSVLPVQALSNEYIINSYSERYREVFVIVAVDDSTIVEIVPTDSSSFTFRLDKGEIYQFARVADWFLSISNPLSGFKIKATSCRNKIAVFAGAPCTGINRSTCDQLYEQLQPLNSFGKEFIAAPPLAQLPALYTIVAVEDATTISLNGALVTLNQSETHKVSLKGEFYLKSDKPVSVAQYVGGSNSMDPYMVMLSPLESKINNAGFIIYNEFAYSLSTYITIFSESKDTSTVYIDNIKPTGFKVFSKNPAYSYIHYPLKNFNNVHYMHCSGGCIGYVCGLQPGDSYGYTIGFGYPLLPQERMPNFSILYAGDTTEYKDFNTIVCSCAPVQFMVKDSFPDLIYQWKFHDGTVKYGTNISHRFLNGDYPVTLSVLTKDSCDINKRALKEHIIVQNCHISMSPNHPVCAEDSVVLSVNAGNTFVWNTGETTQSIKVSPDKTTRFTVFVDGGTANICDSIIVYVKGSRPVINLGRDTTICKGNKVILNAAYDKATYLWQNGSVQPSFTASGPGKYWVTTTNLCGLDQDTMTLSVINPPTVELGPARGICMNTTMELCPITTGVTNFLWNTGSTDSCYVINRPGTYQLTVKNSCFMKTDHVEVEHKVCKDLFIPNLLTPNKDGHNDYFTVLNIEERECTLSVYNRWGDLVYLKDNYANEYNVSSLEDGVYYYLLDDHTTDSHFTGWFQVVSSK